MRYLVLVLVTLFVCPRTGYAEHSYNHNHEELVHEDDEQATNRAVLGHMIQAVLKQAREEVWSDKKIATELQSVLDDMRRESYNQMRREGGMSSALMEQKIKNMSAEVAYFITMDICAGVTSVAALCVASYLVALYLND
jgi:hypothetical protein